MAIRDEGTESQGRFAPPGSACALMATYYAVPISGSAISVSGSTGPNVGTAR